MDSNADEICIKCMCRTFLWDLLLQNIGDLGIEIRKAITVLIRNPIELCYLLQHKPTHLVWLVMREQSARQSEAGNINDISSLSNILTNVTDVVLQTLKQQSQKAVPAHFSSKQLLPFGSAEQYHGVVTRVWDSPAHTRRWINVGLTLVHRLRRWTSAKPTLIQRLGRHWCWSIRRGLPNPQLVGLLVASYLAWGVIIGND